MPDHFNLQNHYGVPKPPSKRMDRLAEDINQFNKECKDNKDTRSREIAKFKKCDSLVIVQCKLCVST